MRLLSQTDHRPWPLPGGSWVMAQTWLDLLFAHWSLPVEELRPLVPPTLELDTFEGRAWVGVVPFRMRGVRPRGLPGLPWVSAFPELNVRTYVRARDEGRVKPGVYFFSLEAANPLAVRIARGLFRLPYFDARMSCDDDGSGGLRYRSERTHRGAPAARFVARYGPSRAAAGSELDSEGGGGAELTAWLTERYALYTTGLGADAMRADARVRIGEIHHAPWPLEPAWLECETEEMARASGIELPDEAPLLHFARELEVVVWRLRALRP